MAEGKKSFVLYVDQRGIFKKLSDEQAGILIKHIFSYVSDENPEGDFVTELAFESIMTSLKRDLIKYESAAERSRENGKLGGRPKNPDKPKKPSRLKNNPDEPRKPDSVNVSVNDNVSDNVTVNEKKTKQKRVYTKDVHDCLFNSLRFFPKHLHPNGAQLENWLDTIDKLNRIEKLSFDIIEGIIKKTRNDDFWAKNFLAIPKLRKKDKNDVMYIVVFNEAINNNGKADKFSEEAISQRLADGVEFFEKRFE